MKFPPDLSSIVIASAVSAAMLIITWWLIPSFATIEVAAETGIVAFDTYGGAILDETVIGVEQALVCGPVASKPAATGGDDCAVGGRSLIEKSFTGSLAFRGKVRVTLAQSSTGLTLTAVPNAATASVVIDQKALAQGCTVFLRPHPQGQPLVAFGALIISAKIGQFGYNESHPARLLVRGTLKALATAAFDHSVLSGPDMTLGLGDVVRLEVAEARGSIYATANGIGPIVVSTRYPAVGVVVERFGGQGVPVDFPWWDRLRFDPTLLAIWAFILFWFGILGMAGKIQEARSAQKGPL
ncbi:hypothetical protein [Rhizobium sp. Leaf453]|uniref:hypothetical protein n=1 Tax=Rhizobium sp. Leaf453 TaxID=1736380 RepID=UPI000713EFFF|nr:hypothetical protein [Rhizobium sp. Leaf453]KQU06081.1 hypothetical protein ASG68_25475 [Rhizobium sp. Leaf453]